MLPHWACVVIMVLVLGWGHWFRWPRQLPKLATYTLGTASIWLGILLYLWPSEMLQPLVAFPFWAGISVLAMYGIDWGLNKLSRLYQELRQARNVRRDS